MNNDCLFCKISAGSIPSEKIYESETLFAINDINPQAPTHILIIPRTHLSSLLDVEKTDHELMGSIITVVNCGEGAGQSVFHIHYHILGGRPLKWPPG
jgi:histidine triad (HIT) family protein